MTLLALLIGLAVERLATQLFHLRRLRWLDRLIDAGFRRAGQFEKLPSLVAILLLVVFLILPVLVALLLLQDRLYGIANFLLAIVVLFFSLGPKDIAEDVDEYCRAIEAQDDEKIRITSKSLLEKDVPEDPAMRIRRVEESVCVQANNRLFAVIFWFVVLGPYGPLGAWTYRVIDLIRRRAVFNASRSEAEPDLRLMRSSERLHGWFIWIPARLTSLGYAMAGSFDGALSAWREINDARDVPAYEHSEHLLARVGIGALALADIDGESHSARGVRGAIAANGLVYRLLLIWAVVIGAMTLYGWSV